MSKVAVTERPVVSPASPGMGFTLGLLLGVAAGGFFSRAVTSNQEIVPEAIDLGRKVEQLGALVGAHE